MMTPRIASASLAAMLLLTTAPLCLAGSPEDAEMLTLPCSLEIHDTDPATWFVYQAEEDGVLLFLTHNTTGDLVIEVYNDLVIESYSEETGGTPSGSCDRDQGHVGNEFTSLQLAEGEVVYLKVRSIDSTSALPEFTMTSSFVPGATLTAPFSSEPGLLQEAVPFPGIDPGFGRNPALHSMFDDE